MKFLFVGHGGYYNRGCEAIVRTTITLLREEFWQEKIILSSFDYKNDRLNNFDPNIKIIPALLNGVWKRFTFPWFIRQMCKLYSRSVSGEVPYLPVINAIKKSDIVLSIGGDNFSMDYDFPDYFLDMNRIVKKNKKKLVIWGASIGPFKEDENLKNIIENLKSVDLITARESATVEYLRQIGVTENVKKVADPAFLLPIEEISLKTIFPEDTRNVLGFNISPILYKFRNNCENNAGIISEIILFLEKIIKETNSYVILIPHVKRNNNYNNDDHFMRQIYEKLKNTKMINLVSADYNAIQIKYIISKCNYFIGSRTHATIAALSSCVPTLSIGYSLKSQGINEDIFGHQKYLLKIEELSAMSLFDKYKTLVNDELLIKNILRIKIPEIENMARLNIKYIKEIL